MRALDLTGQRFGRLIVQSLPLDRTLDGGRGIKVCDRWRFGEEGKHPAICYAEDIALLGAQPDPTYTIDRIDNDGNYEPGNVRWASKLTQIQNRRTKKNKESK